MSGLSSIGKFWIFLSFISSVISCVGFFLPYWIRGQMLIQLNGQAEQTFPVLFGIFRRCNYPAINLKGELTMVLECGRYRTFSDIPSASWQLATLVIGVACGLCLLVSLAALFAICVKGVFIPAVARPAGIIQICSGLLMATSVGMYPNGWDSPEVKQACGNTSSSYTLGDCSLSWCFSLTSTGAASLLLCSVLAFHAPKQKRYVTGYNL